jgi:hypothetical protein
MNEADAQRWPWRGPANHFFISLPSGGERAVATVSKSGSPYTMSGYI